MKHLSGLASLEDLDLYGTAITDRGVESLRNLIALQKLNLLGADVSDASVQTLSRMPHLHELNLYRSHLSNVGLAKLAALKELSSLDVRYTRVTQASVDAFKAAQPQCSIEFSGGSVSASGNSAAVPAGKGDRAVADWVRRLGGKTEFRADILVAISLASTAVTDSQLSNLSGLAALERLDLDATQIGDLGLRLLKSITSLQELSLNNTTVSDAGLASLARDQMMRIAVSESILRQLLGSRAIGFFEQGRQILRIVLILEAADKVLGRKLVRGFGLVTQQVANGVVVLAVCQPPQNRSWAPLCGRTGFIVLQSSGEFVRGHCGEETYPSDQCRLFRTTRFDALAAGMGDASGGFLE
jgi:hypothetical protein